MTDGLASLSHCLIDCVDAAQERTGPLRVGSGVVSHHHRRKGPGVEVGSTHPSVRWKVFNVLISASLERDLCRGMNTSYFLCRGDSSEVTDLSRWG